MKPSIQSLPVFCYLTLAGTVIDHLDRRGAGVRLRAAATNVRSWDLNGLNADVAFGPFMTPRTAGAFRFLVAVRGANEGSRHMLIARFFAF